MSIYSAKFSEVYNKYWTDFSLERAEQFKKFIQNKKHDSLLDLACGSGQFFFGLKDEFVELVGLDLSKDLLKFAVKNNKKSKNISFVYGDMTHFNLERKFDFITCNFDAVNHLETFELWEKFFKMAKKHLNKGGYFVFDYNTKYREIINQNRMGIRKTDEYDMYDFSVCYGSKMVCSYTLYIKGENNKYDKVEETVAESLFENSLIFDAIGKAGFTNIKFCDKDFNVLEANQISKQKRIYVVAQ